MNEITRLTIFINLNTIWGGGLAFTVILSPSFKKI